MPELKLDNSLVDGRYEVCERLSRGSYAEIFIAYDRQANRLPVVIKALNTSLQGTPDADLERTLVENFQNEAIALDAVRHPHVILRMDHGTAADLRGVPFHYLVLEYMPGGDLLELCRHRPGKALSLDEALFYFHQVCEALSYAHSKGIIHRDLKPNNFLLSADKRMVKIADFGVAKISSGESVEITRVGADVYAPPEHNPNEATDEIHQLTTAADVYSLAKSFYTIVCGRAPNQFKCDPVTSLPETMMNLPWATALVKVLRHATEDDPSARYATVGEFWHELAQVAVLAQTVKLEDLPSEETIVKPRLSVREGALPKTPVQPDFDPTPATSHLQEAVAPAVSVEPEPAGQGTPVQAAPAAPVRHAERPGKIFIDLQPQKAVPVAPVQPPQQLPQQPTRQSPQQGKGVKQTPAKPPQRTPPTFANQFSEKVRRRIFIGLMGAALLGLLVSVYNFFSGGFGTPKEVEVKSSGLYVRSGPGTQFDPIGTISIGTRHRVISQNEQGWLQIEVSQWTQLQPNAPLDARQGWINGNQEYVRVVSRRWW
ncbi:MAG TPA: serine/threonine protein kinase [Blastocatellia bacterium]|nr:serine/threonine protein kinase [Blastocatellia bacterium]HMZ21873.1 serine/threonine protein kinase [Blastocatellia bacterium]HNG32670.1 serine/threonine protein kinase [Blastocatellia bacterium]